MLADPKMLRSRYDAGDPGAAEEIRQRLAAYSFYHRIELAPGIYTEGLSSKGHDWADPLIERIIGSLSHIDFNGRRVLDIGCRDGALSFAAESRGAAEVVGIDNDLSPGLADFLIPFRGSRVSAVQCNVNDLTRERFGQFDVVLFSGVLYHLRYPAWALRRIADVMKPGATLLIESGFIDGFGDLPILFCPASVGQPYETTCVTFFNEAGLAATLDTLGFSDLKCVSSYLHAGRRRTVPMFLRAFPRFMRLNWWQSPRVCRKILVCQKRWSDAARAADYPALAEKYWDGGHGYHSGRAL